MNIGQKVVELREKKGWSQQHLATETNLSNATISRLEKGLLKSPEKYLRQLTNALGVAEIEILGIDAPSEDEEITIRIGFSFTLLAAPLAYYQFKRRKSIEGVKLTSFRAKKEQLIEGEKKIPNPIQLYFYSRDNRPKIIWGEERIKTHSTKSLLNLLDQDALDCIVIAGKEVENKKAYTQIAKITSSVANSAELLVCNFSNDQKPVGKDLRQWIHRKRDEEEKAFTDYLFREDDIAFNKFYKKLLYGEVRHQINVGTDLVVVDMLRRSMKNSNVSSFDYNSFCKQMKLLSEKDYKAIIKKVAAKLMKIQLFYSEPAVAKELYDDYLFDEHCLDITHHPIFLEDSSKWVEQIRLAMFPFVNEETNELLVGFRRTVIFLTWQPQIEHIKREITTFFTEKPLEPISFGLFNLVDSYRDVAFSTMTSFSYNIITKHNIDSDLIYSPNFFDFLRELQDCIFEIREAKQSLIKVEKDTELELKVLDQLKVEKEELLGKILLEKGDSIQNVYVAQIKKELKATEQKRKNLEFRFVDLVRSDDVMGTIAQAFDMSTFNCYNAIKMCEFDLEINLSWILHQRGL